MFGLSWLMIGKSVWGFLTSKVGLVFLAILAGLIGMWLLYHEGKVAQKKVDDKIIDGLKLDIQTIKDANKRGAEAQEKANGVLVNQQNITIADLKARLDAELKKPPKVKIVEVTREIETAVNTACTINNGFVWLRDYSFHPEYADLARTAPAEERSANAGLTAAEVAAADGRALEQAQAKIVALEFNLSQWDRWYSSNKAAFDQYKTAMDNLKEQLAVATKKDTKAWKLGVGSL